MPPFTWGVTPAGARSHCPLSWKQVAPQPAPLSEHKRRLRSLTGHLPRQAIYPPASMAAIRLLRPEKMTKKIHIEMHKIFFRRRILFTLFGKSPSCQHHYRPRGGCCPFTNMLTGSWMKTSLTAAPLGVDWALQHPPGLS